MPGIRRQKKMYSRPRKPFELDRITEENEVVKKYGLKNKKELWRADAAISKIRNIAKKLITAPSAEQETFIARLAKKGLLQVGSKMDNVLDLKKEDHLERRLQTIVLKKGFAKTAKQARQLVTHKYVKISDRVINIPSYNVSVDEESKVSVVPQKVKAEKKPVMEAA
jgi:small subunit ribosomal protein S4